MNELVIIAQEGSGGWSQLFSEEHWRGVAIGIPYMLTILVLRYFLYGIWGSEYKRQDDGEWVLVMRTWDKILAPIGTLNVGVFLYIFWFIDYGHWTERYLYSALVLLPVSTFYYWQSVRPPLSADNYDKPEDQKD